MNTEPFRDKLLRIITDLIENKGVTQFYSGFRGDFDEYCSGLVHELKSRYPHIKSTLVFSYIPEAPDDPDCAFSLPECFDDSVYLLDRRVPKRYAIIETNKKLADRVDYIVAGVGIHGGGAYAACEYAGKKGKTILSVFDGWEI